MNFSEAGPGGPNLFGTQAGRDAAFACLDFTPSGGSGSRNTVRGVRFANVDFALQKSFPLRWWEGHKIVFAWQNFNLFNHPNFDDTNMRLNPESLSTFGLYTNTIGADARKNNGRVMQFGLRYEF